MPSKLGLDSNPYRYVDNGPTDGTDPSGLILPDNGDRIEAAYGAAMRQQNAYGQAYGGRQPLTEAQIQACLAQARAAGAFAPDEHEPNPLYNDFWARAYQCEVQIFSDAVPFARGFVAGVGSGAWSFGEGVANLIRGLPGSVGQIIEGITNLIGALVELRWDAAARQAFPDLYRLVSEWSSVGAYDKGYLAGRVVGQYGAAVLTGMGVSRILGMVRSVQISVPALQPAGWPSVASSISVSVPTALAPAAGATIAAGGLFMSVPDSGNNRGEGVAGNLRQINPTREGIDAEALKRDFAFGQAGEFNLAVDTNGQVWLVPVRRGNHPNVPTGLTVEQAAEFYPL